MKRHPSLVQLSREHHSALVLAKRAQRADPATPEARRLTAGVAPTFARELEPHFRIEEQALLPLLAKAGEVALVERTLAEHLTLRSLAERLAAGEVAALASFGRALEEHVRFEERELFLGAESRLGPDALAKLSG
jgi:hemerythrin-like domain-containing protein